MRRLIAARKWQTVFYLPTTAPELNPVEGVWSVMKSGLVNLVKRDIAALTSLARTRLRRMQYRPRLPAGLLAKTGLDLQPQQKLHQHAELSRQLAEGRADRLRTRLHRRRGELHPCGSAKGLTTAAGIWLTRAVGAACALGLADPRRPGDVHDHALSVIKPLVTRHSAARDDGEEGGDGDGKWALRMRRGGAAKDSGRPRVTISLSRTPSGLVAQPAGSAAASAAAALQAAIGTP